MFNPPGEDTNSTNLEVHWESSQESNNIFIQKREAGLLAMVCDDSARTSTGLTTEMPSQTGEQCLRQKQIISLDNVSANRFLPLKFSRMHCFQCSSFFLYSVVFH